MQRGGEAGNMKEEEGEEYIFTLASRLHESSGSVTHSSNRKRPFSCLSHPHRALAGNNETRTGEGEK
jgi:hypothetical protein